MFKRNQNKKQQIINEKLNSLGQPIIDTLSDSLQKNVEILKEMYKDVDVLITREIVNHENGKLRYFIACIDGLVESSIINESIIKPIMLFDSKKMGAVSIEELMNRVIMSNEIKTEDSWEKINDSLNYGDTILFMDGVAKALIINSKGFTIRSLDEPEGEKILSGPREGFCEALLINLSLIRRRIRSCDLKMKFVSFGERTKTQACVCYLDSLVNKKILKRLMKKLEQINIDGILDSNYIVELIKDNRWSPFESIGRTERPDVIAGKILEGRIAIFVDGSPVVLTVPYLFIENFQSNEDYYMNFYYTSFSRFLRMIAFFITCTVPGYYIAIVAYHREMLPTPLFTSITIEVRSVPLPAALEAFVMLLVFDILRETGIRMPTKVGQALSIVGALVIGQSAVEAKLVAAPMIIVVAMTGITNLIVPKLSGAAIIFRYFLLFLGSTLGLEGVTCGLALIVVQILNLTSFGVPQLITSKSLKFQEIKDVVIRAPWWNMITRPRDIPTESVRQAKGDSSD